MFSQETCGTVGNDCFLKVFKGKCHMEKAKSLALLVSGLASQRAISTFPPFSFASPAQWAHCLFLIYFCKPLPSPSFVSLESASLLVENRLQNFSFQSAVYHI